MQVGVYRTQVQASGIVGDRVGAEMADGHGGSLDPDIIGRSARAALMARIGHATRLYEEQLYLSFRAGLVPYSLRHDVHLAGGQTHYSILEVDSQCSIEDYEGLIGVLVVVPDEIAVDPDQRDLVVVHLGNDLWVPLVREQLEFASEIDCSMRHENLSSLPPARPAGQPATVCPCASGRARATTSAAPIV